VLSLFKCVKYLSFLWVWHYVSGWQIEQAGGLSVLARLRAWWPRNQGSISGKGWDFLSMKLSEPALPPTLSYIYWIVGGEWAAILAQPLESTAGVKQIAKKPFSSHLHCNTSESPDIECQWGRHFPCPPRPAMWPTQQWVCPGLNRLSRVADQFPSSSAGFRKGWSYIRLTSVSPYAGHGVTFTSKLWNIMKRITTYNVILGYFVYDFFIFIMIKLV
jgi:hypothetical protein